MSLLAALLAAIGYAAASVLQSAGARGRGSTRALVRSPSYLAGLGLDGVSWALTLVALRSLPVYAVQAVLASSLAFTVLLARIWLKATLRRRDIAAIGTLGPALAVVGIAGREQPAPTPGSTVVIVLTVAGVVVSALVVAALVRPRRTDARAVPALAVLAGLAFSVTALAARAVEVRSPLWHTIAAPLPWVVVATGIAGAAAYAAALERGAVGPATALLWAVEVVVPAVVAIPLLGDGVRAGWLIPLAAAIALVVASSVVLAGSPAPLAVAHERVDDPRPSAR